MDYLKTALEVFGFTYLFGCWILAVCLDDGEARLTFMIFGWPIWVSGAIHATVRDAIRERRTRKLKALAFVFCPIPTMIVRVQLPNHPGVIVATGLATVIVSLCLANNLLKTTQ